MTAKTSLRIFCPVHEAAFEVPKNPKVLCEITGHALSTGFPHSEFWEFCCNCETFTPNQLDKGEKARRVCYGCNNEISKRYVCDSCQTVSFECREQTKGRSYFINPKGLEPNCPGCKAPSPSSLLKLHECPEIEAEILTGRTSCPFCLEKIAAAITSTTAAVLPDTPPHLTNTNSQICPQCQAFNPPNTVFCGNCRYQLRTDVSLTNLGSEINKSQLLGSLCPNCSTPIPPDSGFCGECGQAVKKALPLPPPPPVKILTPAGEAGILPAPSAATVAVSGSTDTTVRNIIFAVAGVFAIIVTIAIVTSISKSGYNASANTATPGNNDGRINTGRSKNVPASAPNIAVSSTPNQSNSDNRIGKNGTLNVDTNLRESAGKDYSLIGTHYRGAKITILDVETVSNANGTTTDWFKVQVTAYGNSMDPSKYGLSGKDPGSEDIGWVNSYPEVYEGKRKKRIALITFN